MSQHAHQQVFSTGEWWDFEEFEPNKFRRVYVNADLHYFHPIESSDGEVCAKCDAGRHEDARPVLYSLGQADKPVRTFTTGATRDTEDGKLDYEGFLSPLVLKRFAEYMHKHRIQADGSLRDSDNWQRGIPLDAYMKSGWRHFMDWWAHHRYRAPDPPATEMLEDALCALLFNVQGYLHEIVKARRERV